MILIQPPTVQNWNSLINKPSILSDDQISWDEIQNKPTTLDGFGITGGTITGNLSIAGSLRGTGTGVGMYETSPLGTVAGNTQLLSTKTGLVSNIASERTWIRRRIDGFNWETASFHNGITVDTSFLTPGVNTKAWWERDIRAGSQSWGNGNTTFFSVDSSRFHIPLTTPSTSTTTGAITAASLGITGAIFAGTLNGNGSGLTTLNASNLSSGAVNIARIPTGTTSTTVSLGDHTHNYLPLAGGILSDALTIKKTVAGAAFEGLTIWNDSTTTSTSAAINLVANTAGSVRACQITSISPAGINQSSLVFKTSNSTLPTTVLTLGYDLTATFEGNVKAVSFVVGLNQVVSARRTGWAVPTGTATRTTFATSTVTLSELAETVKALIDDLTAHGLIGE